MIKFYIVPSIGTGTSADPIRPKYMDDLKINHSCIHIPAKNVYLIVINTRQAQKISALEKNSDIIDLTDNTRAIKNRIRTLLNSGVIADTEDVVTFIARLREPRFNKENFRVESD